MVDDSFAGRSLVPQDCERLPELLEKVWNVKSNSEYWRWRYLEPPFETEAWVIENGDGEIIGLNGFWLRPVKVGDEVLPLYLSIDTMIDPEYQHTPASSNIIKYFSQVSKRMPMYGFANEISYKFFTKFLGHIISVDAESSGYQALLNIGSVAGVPQPLETLANLVSRGVHKIGNRLHGTPKFEVVNDGRIDGEFNELWRETSPEFYWVPKRDKDYLRWRYLNAPGSKCQIWKARDKGKLVGYLVSTTSATTAGQRGQIVDWFVSPQRPDVLSALLTAACRWHLDHDIDAVEAWLLSYPPQWEKILKSHLFLVKRNPRTVLHTGFPQGDAEMNCGGELCADDMMLALGDSDFLGWASATDFEHKDRRH